jgi:hypothetical protein
MPNHITIGVYPNNSYILNIVKDEHIDGHIVFNSNMRPGRFLFVNGKYTCGGLLKDEFKEKFISEWEEKISKMTIDSSVPTIVYR